MMTGQTKNAFEFAYKLGGSLHALQQFVDLIPDSEEDNVKQLAEILNSRIQEDYSDMFESICGLMKADGINPAESSLSLAKLN
ncbi:hypothetical protein ACVFI8_00045 [Agarivorans sp. MS3-6]